MRSGKGGLIAIFGGLALLLGGGLVFLLLGDEDDPYRNFGQSLNGIKAEHFDAFWDCAFQAREDVEGNEALEAEIHERAANGQQRYATYLRDECLGKLQQLEVQLRALIPPEEMQADVNALIAATERMRGAWSDYLSYLDDLEGEYDASDARARVRSVARGWYEYKTAHSRLNSALSERLH